MKFLIVTVFLIGTTVAQFGAPAYRGGFRRPTTTPQYQQPQYQPQQPQYQPENQYRTNIGPQIAIRSQTQDSSPDGSYNYAYETENGISVSEEGSPKAAGPEGPAETVRGRFQYTAPDGTPIIVEYYADETGFHPSGAHLPTPPPIPEAIARAVASLPPSNEGQYVEEPINRNQYNQNQNNYRRF
ncbi:hypothetical protein HCN44_003910 [Aphidius gifuensis]|uniref:Cuticular protein n=1 Tax=Aphidius gifuensis TaxID=684658 RepID=A0A834XVX0_APHGI|nr:endocuticle structural glycoprotein SgAbd-2-like [Aphidius gifuensis]KAF7994438.1 hypothetical protein HCN44_003910 [Aphidius gifuensis]